MDIKKQIQEDLKGAMKNKDAKMSLVLRSLISEINKKEIELGKKDEGLTDAEVSKIIMQELKKRKESKEQYTSGGREDLAEEEQAEADIIEKYAPEQMSDEEINKVIDDIIKEKNPSGMQDIGMIMKEAMQKIGSGAEGSKISSIVKEKLSNL